MAIFQVTVQTTTSQPITGAALRLFNPNGLDITATRLGASAVLTDASGTFTRFFATMGPDRLPSGIYSITASAAGYISKSIETTILFTGTGSFVIELTPIAYNPETGGGGALIAPPASSFVSPVASVEAIVGGTEGVIGWEYIEATITNSAGESSTLEVPIVNGLARINLQARLELEPLLQLIPDGAEGIVDQAFSDQVSVTLASLTSAGLRPLTDEFSLSVANAFPIGEANDLTNFTNSEGLADWLTPWEELPKFLGHFADVGLWLPNTTAGSYVLQIEYRNINRATINQRSVDLSADLFAPGKVVKIRVPEPIAGATYATLTVTLAGIAQTKPLSIHYHNG